MEPISKQDALDYHSGARPGKIEVKPTKACVTQRDLSLAYTPGVAEPCLQIKKNPFDAFKYTARGWYRISGSGSTPLSGKKERAPMHIQ